MTFNSRKFIKSCLESIFAQGVGDIEVIVVDNGSKDNTTVFIRENYPQVRLIENKENLGSAKARNQGIDVTRGEWILTLDCDVILEKDFLPNILELTKNLPPRLGVIQPKILMADRNTIFSCGIYLSKKLRRFYDIGKGKLDNGQFNFAKCIFGVCSACALYKKEMLEEIKEETGYFDEGFFFLVEDVDLSWRAQNKGWRTLYYPEAKSFHYGNSSETSKEIRQYLCFRNRYFMIKKNETLSGKARLLSSSFGYEIARLFY